MYEIHLDTVFNITRTKLILVIAFVVLVGGGTTSYLVASSRSQALKKQSAQQHSLQAATNTDAALKLKLGTVANSTSTQATSDNNLSSSRAVERAGVSHIPQRYNSYTNSQGSQIESPDSNSLDATALCVDGTYSHSASASGTCSSHGGIYHEPSIPATTAPAVICDTVTQQSYVSSYNSSVNSENSNYQNQLDQIQFQYSQQLGGNMSGMINNSISQASYQHQQNLSSLLTALNYKLISINCSTQ